MGFNTLAIILLRYPKKRKTKTTKTKTKKRKKERKRKGKQKHDKQPSDHKNGWFGAVSVPQATLNCQGQSLF